MVLLPCLALGYGAISVVLLLGRCLRIVPWVTALGLGFALLGLAGEWATLAPRLAHQDPAAAYQPDRERDR